MSSASSRQAGAPDPGTNTGSGLGSMPRPGAPAPDGASRSHPPDWLILTLVCLAQFMVVLDISIVNVALPSIQRSLGFSEANLQWVLTAYALTFGGLLLLGGRMADLFGRRRIFLIGLALFTSASLIGGFANNQTTLIAARALQGVGGAVLSPATLTILTVTFTDQKARARALGMWSAVAAGGGAAGALFGGVLTEFLSWRWILFVNVPIGVALFLAARHYLIESKAEGPRQRLDIAGSLAVTAGLVALVYAIVNTDRVAWGSTSTLVTLAVAVALLGGFVLIEAKLAQHPLIPLRLFRSRGVTGANLAMLCFGASMFSMWFFLTLYLQQVLGYSPLVTGFGFLPQTAAIAAGATISGRLAPKFGPRNMLVVGTLLTAGGLYWLSFITATDTYWNGAFGGGVLCTLGMGLALTPIALSATNGVRRTEAGLASGLVNTSRQVGASLGLAILSTLAASRIGSVLAGHRSVGELGRQAMTAGYSRGFLVASIIVLAAGFLALIIPATASSRDRTTPAHHEELSAEERTAASDGGPALPSFAD